MKKYLLNVNTGNILIGLIFLSCHTVNAQLSTGAVQVSGAMKNVMWKGQLYGTINLDTITDKKNLYGLGPVEYLKGELMIVDGKSYKSTFLTDSTMKVEETFHVKAPFFVYANVGKWTEHLLPDSILTMQELEHYLDKITTHSKRPFAFKLNGKVKKASIHIVNLPEGAVVSAPNDAHKGQVNFALQNETSEIIGFFSTEHKAIFTHHDTFIHMHLITSDKSRMGHIDDVQFEGGKMKLSLPE